MVADKVLGNLVILSSPDRVIRKHGKDPLMNKNSMVYVVHCVDAEGPLYESLEATFERVYQIFGIKLSPSRETLIKLQHRKFDLSGQEEAVARVVAPHLLAYNDTWDKIDAMLERIGDASFRNQHPDSEGGGWIYNWHCVDHVGYSVNPRRRDIGYHNVFDHYRNFIDETQAPDGLHWHFHPTHPSGWAHKSATLYLRDTKFFDILTRRLIDRNWFPSVNRAGFHTERPDSHWILEQWIPFDMSNQACNNPDVQPDQANGRFGDWRRASVDWSIYHPHHDDYQIPGACRRYIAQCLNVGTRLCLLGEHDVRKAFERARQEGPTVMAFTNHDFRDIGGDVQNVINLLRKVAPDYPDVRYRYSEAREAMNRTLFGEYVSPNSDLLVIKLESGTLKGSKVLTVEAREPVFGPQPFLAMQTADGEYYHDNFDIQEPFRHWTYVFDDHTFPWRMIDTVVVATNDRRGFPHVVRVEHNESDR